MGIKSKGKSLKGKAVVFQSGGCTAVINQSLCGVIEGARLHRSITDLWGAWSGVTGILREDYVDLMRQPKSLLQNIREQPSSTLGSARYKLQKYEEEVVLSCLKKRDIRFLFMIGGNDTAQTALRIAKAAERESYDLNIIHVPKTIDNDLVETDHTPGYGSVARFAAIITQEVSLDTQAMRQVEPVKIMEFMGRNSGWIAASSALLKRKQIDPPHLLLVPEVPFDEDKFLMDVDRTLSHVGYCIISISETIRDKDGKRVGERTEGILNDSFGHPYVEGAASRLVQLVESRLKVRARCDKPGTIQRMSMPYISPIDQKEAFQAGKIAVNWAVKGQSKVMVSFKRHTGKKYGISYEPVPLEKIPGQERYLPESFFDSIQSEVTPNFYRYALPLLGENLPQFPPLKPIPVKL